jgi:hypothetical protein
MQVVEVAINPHTLVPGPPQWLTKKKGFLFYFREIERERDMETIFFISIQTVNYYENTRYIIEKKLYSIIIMGLKTSVKPRWMYH